MQEHGNFTDAYQIAIDNASGDIILFIDYDAVAEERWVEKCVQLFEELSSAGGLFRSWCLGVRFMSSYFTYFSVLA